jgi:hypothetical protein
MTDTARTRQTPSVPTAYRRPADTQRVTAAKARLRVALDEQLGRTTPQSVKDLAARKQ